MELQRLESEQYTMVLVSLVSLVVVLNQRQMQILEERFSLKLMVRQSPKYVLFILVQVLYSELFPRQKLPLLQKPHRFFISSLVLQLRRIPKHTWVLVLYSPSLVVLKAQLSIFQSLLLFWFLGDIHM